MSEIKHRDRILEAIDQLRRRKARPDLTRICSFLLRRFSIDYQDTKADLQRCVENAIVFKVEYKGNISYRNATKNNGKINFKKSGSIIKSECTSDSERSDKYFTNLLTNAITELIVQEPDYLELGVPGPEIIRRILNKDSVKYNKRRIYFLLEREVIHGSLVRLENGNYLLGPSASEKFNENEDSQPERQNIQAKSVFKKIIKSPKKDETRPINRKVNPALIHKHFNSAIISPQLNTPQLGFRVGVRRKRAKKVFDPSDNNLPKLIRKRSRFLNSSIKPEKPVMGQIKEEQNGQTASTKTVSPTRKSMSECCVCQNQGKKDMSSEKTISCNDCTNRAHYSCLSSSVLKEYANTSIWKCPYCKQCVICFETSEEGNLSICSVCSEGYHWHCHEPRITEKAAKKAKWKCFGCSMADVIIPCDVKKKHSNKSDSNESRTGTGSRNSPTLLSDHSMVNSSASSPIPPTLSPQAVLSNGRHSSLSNDKSNLSDIHSNLEFEENYDPSIPDATNWTYDDVYNYFYQYFPDEAQVFREQEIDGHSLLLMRRIDVLTSLKLKLGPALKIYRHVLKLQIRRDDPRLFWL